MFSAAAMPDGPLIAKRWQRWGLMFGVYTLIGLFFVGQDLVRQLTRDEALTGHAIASQMAYWYIWLLLTPAIVTYARRFRIERRTWKRSILLHLLLCMVVAPLQEVLWYAVRYLGIYGNTIQEVQALWPRMSGWILVGSLTSFYKYWLIIGIYYLFDYARRDRLREQEANALQLHAAHLESQLTHAQLDALKMQLQPHFLFNTLNAIGVLMQENVSKASRMLVRLSELLRMTLDGGQRAVVSVQHEMDFLKRYLDIESIRFEDRLTVTWEIAPDARDCAIPSLILQPLVENAVRHGIASLADAGHLAIRAHRQEGHVILEVEDDGPGIPADTSETSSGIGLANVEARLKQHYGEAYTLEFIAGKPRGTCVRMILPADATAEAV